MQRRGSSSDFPNRASARRHLRIALQFGAQHVDDVVGGDYPGQHAVVIDHWKGEQVVLVEDLGHLFLVGSGVDGAGNRLAFGSRTTDNSFMQGECWTSQRRARRGAWTHL